MNGVARAPLLQLVERPTEVIEYLLIDELDVASGRHDRDQSWDRIEDQAEFSLGRHGPGSIRRRLARLRYVSRTFATAGAQPSRVALHLVRHAPCLAPWRGRLPDTLTKERTMTVSRVISERSARRVAVGLMTILTITVGVEEAQMATALAASGIKNVVLVHGGFVDGSGWRDVYDILKGDGFAVTIVQNPTNSLADDVAVTKRALTTQSGPAILVGHSYGGVVITEARS